MMADQGMRFALHLMFLARRHRQRRTDNMFKLFMAATLLNGELIIFSLLFGWACRDWQTAFNLELKLDVLPEDHPLQETTKVEGLKLRLTHLQSESIFPDAEMLDKGLSVIDAILALDGELDSVSHRRLVALQALGNLAGLLERQQIPFAQISTLVRSMYKCPRVDDEIWIVGLGGCPERIKAYDYFHSVLEKLIQNVPKQPPAVRSKKALRPNSIVRAYTFPILPPLSVQSYNALLHYSLRHRLSPGMGNQLLRHMTVERYEPLAPDSVTTNILLRSATLLRKDEMSTDVLSALVSEQLQFITAPPQKTEIVVDERKWGRKLERVSTARVVIPPLRTDLDVYLITTYISYLVSRRQSQAVKELLFQIIPELDSKKYPTNESHDKAQRKFGREALLSGLQRAIWLGPVFLTCMLNALSKLGHPALADRVWQLAKKAEKCSWLRQHVPEREPWIFGPEVYTVMMDCYGQLSRRQKPWRLTLDPNRRISKRTAGHSVWGSFQYECQKLPDRNGPDVNALLHRFMGHAALQVFLRFMQLPKVHQQVTQLKIWLPPENLPKPDARFFNSALWVFRPRMKAQRTRLHREHLSQVQDAFTRTGVPAQDGGWNPALQQVAEHMVASGYPIPYGLRYLFVGHLENMGDAAPVDRRPGVFAHGRYQPSGNQRFRLPTAKHRGLPLAKRYRASRRNR
ncbi:unnamed protein product [Mycena citricolor]|uniref:Uncharacterized protein n=1 Tax=Mycena citricolor TaxID=2018698 RepID=A0AAD2HFK9_9AGAR|nr:unnamed protein product [Mycena citricolor]